MWFLKSVLYPLLNTFAPPLCWKQFKDEPNRLKVVLSALLIIATATAWLQIEGDFKQAGPQIASFIAGFSIAQLFFSFLIFRFANNHALQMIRYVDTLAVVVFSGIPVIVYSIINRYVEHAPSAAPICGSLTVLLILYGLVKFLRLSILKSVVLMTASVIILLMLNAGFFGISL